MSERSENAQVSSKYQALCSRLRQRLITVPKPGAQAFKPTYPLSYTHTAGTVHKPGDSAGYVTFNPTIGACAAGYDSNNVLMIEHIFVVDPLCEEAAQALEDAGHNPTGNETVVIIPPRPRSLQSGWLLTGSQISQEQALQAFVAHADAAHDEIIRLWRENARMRSQLQQETGVCPHGKPLALSECLSCVGTNAQKASESHGPVLTRVCPGCNTVHSGPLCPTESEGEDRG